MHRRPLGRGRTLAAIGGVVILVGCVLPWWQVGQPGGLPPLPGNALRGQRHPRLPGRRRDARCSSPCPTPSVTGRPRSTAGRRTRSSRSSAGSASAGGSCELLAAGAFRFTEPAQVFTNGPGLWLAAHRPRHPVARRLPDDPRAALPLRRRRHGRPTTAARRRSRRSLAASMSAGSWVVARTVTRRRPARPAVAPPPRARPGRARPSARRGSSSSGSAASARASATRSRSPADSPSGARSAWSPSPNRSRAAIGPRSRRRSGADAADGQAELDVLAGGQERHEVADLVDDADARRAEAGEPVAVERREVRAERDDPAARSDGRGRSRGAAAWSCRCPDGPVTTWKPTAPERALVGGSPSIAAVARRRSGGRRRSRTTASVPSSGARPPARAASTGSGSGGASQPWASRTGRGGRARAADPFGDRPTVGDVDDPVGDPLDELVVGDDRGRSLPSARTRSRRTPRIVSAVRAIELAGRLVGEQERRPSGQGHGERDALLLPARQLVAVARRRGPAARPARAARRRVGVARPPATPRRASGRPIASAAVQVRRQRPSVVLLDDADPLAAMARRAPRSEAIARSAPRTVEPARRRAVEPGDEAQQRRLARAGRPDDGGDLAARRRCRSRPRRAATGPPRDGWMRMSPRPTIASAIDAAPAAAAHAARPDGSRAAPPLAERRAGRTSGRPASATVPEDDDQHPADDDGDRERRHDDDERRDGRLPSASMASAPVTTTVSTSPTTSPATLPPMASQARPRQGVPAQRRGRHALGLEVGQLAALVAQVGHGAEDQPADRQGQPGERRHDQGPDDGLAERVGRPLGHEVGPRRSTSAKRNGVVGRARSGPRPARVGSATPIHISVGRPAPGTAAGDGDEERVERDDHEARARRRRRSAPGRPTPTTRSGIVPLADVQVERAVGVAPSPARSGLTIAGRTQAVGRPAAPG